MSSKISRAPLWAEASVSSIVLTPPNRNGELVTQLLKQAVAIGGLLLSLKICMQYLDPYREQRDKAKKRGEFLRKALGKALDLDEFEQVRRQCMHGCVH